MGVIVKYRQCLYVFKINSDLSSHIAIVSFIYIRVFSLIMKFLKPKKLNTIITLVVLILPILSERVPLSPNGPYVVENYSPIVLIFSYAFLGDLFPFFQMLCFSLLIYILVSLCIKAFVKICYHLKVDK